MAPSRIPAGKGGTSVDIYTYALFAYGLTAIISLVTIGIILAVNKITTHI